MDIEKLVERMNNHLQSLAAYSDPELAHTLEDAAIALSTLQAENEKLRTDSIMHHNAADNYWHELNEYRQERNEALTELEQVKAERDAAVKDLNEFLLTPKRIVNYLCLLVPVYLFLPIAITLAALGGSIYGTIEANEHD